MFEGGVGSKFAEEQALRRDVDDRQFGDDVVDDFHSGERQCAFFKDFRLAVARGVLHGDENALGSGNEVHGAAHALEHFAGNGPVGESAFFVHLQRAENGEVHVAAANHGERISGRKIRGAGKFGDGFFARIDEVGINFRLQRIGADAKHAVFGLQNHIHAFGNVVGDQRGHANAKIDVVAVAQFQRDAPCNAFPFLFFAKWHSYSVA